MSRIGGPYEERLFGDHLAFQLEQGSVDFSTMVMEVPEKKSVTSYLVKAHEVIHLKLTYSTTLGIFLDLLATLSTVKLMNILREAPQNSLHIPLFPNKDEESPFYGQILFAFILEKALFYGAEVWRPLQEALATYMMIEEAPRILESDTMFTSQDIKKAVFYLKKYLKEHIKDKSLYYNGYLRMKEISQKLGHRQVYAACFLASDLPFYSKIFVPGDTREMRGDVMYTELQTFSSLLRHEFNPSKRLEWIKNHVDKTLLEEDLHSFDPFIVPQLFPDTNWEERNSQWIEHVISFLGANTSTKFSKQAAAGFRIVTEQGNPPVVLDSSGNEMSFIRNQEFGLLKYVLGSLKAGCYYGKKKSVILPEDWKTLSASSFIEDAQHYVKKHQLPLIFRKGKSTNE